MTLHNYWLLPSVSLTINLWKNYLCSLPLVSYFLVLHLTVTFEILPPLLKWNCPFNDHINLWVSNQYLSWAMSLRHVVSSPKWLAWLMQTLPHFGLSNVFLSWFPFTSVFADTFSMACTYFLSVGMLSLEDLILIHACTAIFVLWHFSTHTPSIDFSPSHRPIQLPTEYHYLDVQI